jgi:hypothetical protein
MEKIEYVAELNILLDNLQASQFLDSGSEKEECSPPHPD